MFIMAASTSPVFPIPPFIYSIKNHNIHVSVQERSISILKSKVSNKHNHTGRNLLLSRSIISIEDSSRDYRPQHYHVETSVFLTHHHGKILQGSVEQYLTNKQQVHTILTSPFGGVTATIDALPQTSILDISLLFESSCMLLDYLSP